MCNTPGRYSGTRNLNIPFHGIHVSSNSKNDLSKLWCNTFGLWVFWSTRVFIERFSLSITEASLIKQRSVILWDIFGLHQRRLSLIAVIITAVITYIWPNKNALSKTQNSHNDLITVTKWMNVWISCTTTHQTYSTICGCIKLPKDKWISREAVAYFSE